MPPDPGPRGAAIPSLRGWIAVLLQERRQWRLNRVIRRVLALLERRGQHVGRWADDKELAEWNQRVEQAKSRIPPANDAFAAAVNYRNSVVSKLQETQAELEKIGAEEIRLKKRLAGESFVDPELGLQSA